MHSALMLMPKREKPDRVDVGYRGVFEIAQVFRDDVVASVYSGGFDLNGIFVVVYG